jgi:parallel beta-helix repeat protein
MIKSILASIFILFFTAVLHAQDKALTGGMKISKSTKIKKGIYKIDALAEMEEAVIIVEGDNITIDFNNAELKGSNTTKRPDEFSGVAILVRNCKNVTIKNLVAKGYKVALRAMNVEKLTLENCDFSYNYRQHLNSSQEKEDISDWMSYHHNEKDEWFRYGAAMYLRNCNFATIKNCKVTGGQNALMMMECNDGLIVNNDFSFNSGIGIGMYRSSNNRIIYNRIIFNVRGYSHEVYNRGQDSAGILVYEQSSNNLFYKNNVTHGGDGFFLWAGQTTMDSGEGGCNNNLVYGNDFSYAPTNGIEATFSSNSFYSNIINECDYGIWGGYSYHTTIRNSKIKNNRIGIAIEHGQDNNIWMNVFENNRIGIKLWANKIEPSDWGYPKKRDTRSWHYEIANNFFIKNGKTFNISATDSLLLAENYVDTDEVSLLLKDSTFKHWGVVYNNDTTAIPFLEGDMIRWPGSILKAGKPLIIPDSTYAGRKNIMITEWGPYDFNSPIIWNTNPTDTSDIMKFDLLGPKGKWHIKNFRGVQNISANKGEFPASITAQKIKGERTDIFIELEYNGSAITTPFGDKIAAGTPFTFSFKKFFQPINWDVMFYPLDTAHYNPIRSGNLFSLTERKAPFKTEKVNKLDYAWWGGIKEADITYPQFITVAAGTAEFPKRDYELSVTWDDAIRVYVDEKLVIDEWNPSLYTFDESPHKMVRLSLGGTHQFRVEHIELGGFATLSLKLKPVE